MLHLACIGILTSSPALAGELPDVAVVGIHQAGLTVAQQDALAQRLVEAIDSHGRARGLLPAQVAGTILGRERVIVEEGLGDPGRARLQAAIDLYNQAQPDAAAGLLQEAMFELERAFPGNPAVDDLWTAWVTLGMARLQAGGDPTEAFLAAAALGLDRSLDAVRYPPDVVAAYDEAVSTLRAQATSLTIAGEGTVTLDGIDRGPAPVTVAQVPPGTHHVVLSGPEGRRGYARAVIPPAAPAEGGSVGPAPPVELKVTVEEPWLGSAADSSVVRSAQAASLYEALGARASEIELVLLAGVDGDSLHMQLYHPSSNAFSRPVEVPYADDATDELLTTLPLLLNLVDPEGAPTATAPAAIPLDVGANSELASMLLHPRAPLPLASEEPTRSRGWVIGVVGGLGLAALVGGGVALAVTGGPDEPPAPIQNGTIVIDF